MQKVTTADIVNNNVKFLSQKLSFKKDFFGNAPAPFVGFGRTHAMGCLLIPVAMYFLV